MPRTNPITKVCKYCGKDFKTLKDRQTICSAKCRDQYRWGNCIVCGTRFYHWQFTQIVCGFNCIKVINKARPRKKIKVEINGVKTPKHRAVAEFFLGRALHANEVVHHIDFNPMNNEITNLQVMDKDEHDALHNRLKNFKIKFFRNIFKASVLDS